jgi:hypothetical protein
MGRSERRMLEFYVVAPNPMTHNPRMSRMSDEE